MKRVIAYVLIICLCFSTGLLMAKIPGGGVDPEPIEPTPSGGCGSVDGCEAGGDEPNNEEPAQSQAQTVTNMPALQNFSVESTYTANELNFTFTPKGSSMFQLHVKLKNENGRDVVSGWCTGNEDVCKSMGNGKTCSGTDYSGVNMWCYKAQ